MTAECSGQMTNSKGQSPCLISSYLFTPCSSSAGEQTWMHVRQNNCSPCVSFLGVPAVAWIPLQHTSKRPVERDSLSLQYRVILDHFRLCDLPRTRSLHNTVSLILSSAGYLLIPRVDGRRTSRTALLYTCSSELNPILHSGPSI